MDVDSADYELGGALPIEGEFDGTIAQSGQYGANATFTLTEKEKDKFVVAFSLDGPVPILTGPCGRHAIPKNKYELPVTVRDKTASGAISMNVSGETVVAYFTGRFDDAFDNATLAVNLDIQKRLCKDPQLSGSFKREKPATP